jgi:hypothetical protein
VDGLAVIGSFLLCSTRSSPVAILAGVRVNDYSNRAFVLSMLLEVRLSKIDGTSDGTWLDSALAQLSTQGFAVIGGMLSPERVETYRGAVFRVREKTIAAVGPERFAQSVAAGSNELRLPFHI